MIEIAGRRLQQNCILHGKRLGFIGLGNIGQAVVLGLLKDGRISRSQIAASVATQTSAIKLSSTLGVNVCCDNRKIAKESDVIILAVKWDRIDEVLTETAPQPGIDFQEKLVISMAGAMSAEYIEQRLPCESPVVLAIPNSACSTKAGTRLMVHGNHTGVEDLLVADAIFGCLGSTVWVSPKQLDRCIAMSSSAPAYFYFFVEALMDAGKSMGLPASLSRQLALEAMFGAATMLVNSGDHPSALRKSIMTPGGCTIAAINELEKANIRTTIAAAARAAVQRLKVMRQSLYIKSLQ